MVLLIPAQQSTAQSLGSPDDPARKSQVHKGKSQHSHGIIDPLCINAWESRHHHFIFFLCSIQGLELFPDLLSRCGQNCVRRSAMMPWNCPIPTSTQITSVIPNASSSKGPRRTPMTHPRVDGFFTSPHLADLKRASNHPRFRYPQRIPTAILSRLTKPLSRCGTSELAYGWSGISTRPTGTS